MSTCLQLVNGQQNEDQISVPLSISSPQPDMVKFSECPRVAEDVSYKLGIISDEIDAEDIMSASVCVNGQETGTLYPPCSDPQYLRVFDPSDGFRDETEVQRPFHLHYDLTTVSVRFHMRDGSSFVLYTGFLLCGSRSEEDAGDIRELVNELLNFDDGRVGAWLFARGDEASPSEDGSGGSKFAYTSLNSYVKLVEHVAETYKDNYAYFAARAKHTIVREQALVSSSDVRFVTRRSFSWLMQNLDQLAPVAFPTGISHSGTSYMPNRMQAEVGRGSLDVYENRVLLGFLCTVIRNARRVLSEFRYGFYGEEDSSVLGGGVPANDENAASFSVPILTIKSLFTAYFADQQNVLEHLIEELDQIYAQYAALFNMSAAPLDCMPRHTNTFREIRSYSQVFQAIISWFRYGQFSLARDRSMLQMKTLDKLFEYYCLCRLLQLFANHGYRRTDALFFEYTAGDTRYENEKDIANTYVLRRGLTEVTLYYQPVIHGDGTIENNLGLYRTTRSLDRTIRPYYTPDFVIKVSREGCPDQYAVLDAKFSRRSAIRRYSMPEVLLKYFCEVNTTSGDLPKMVWVLQGRHEPCIPVENGQWSPLARAFGTAFSYGIANVTVRQSAKDGFERYFWGELCRAMPQICADDGAGMLDEESDSAQIER